LAVVQTLTFLRGGTAGEVRVPRAKVVSIINYKGGVGKTTTTYHVGCSLAQHHQKKVLLIDIDPQTNLTFLCAPVEDWERVKQKTGRCILHQTPAFLVSQMVSRLASSP
jgi:hypothetical protein